MLFTQYFIGFQLSGSLWASTPFWVGVALLGSYPLVKRVSRRARTSQIGGAANPQ
jgi:hypothetical protein